MTEPNEPQQLFQIFEKKAGGYLQVLRGRGIYRLESFNAKTEKLKVTQTENDDGTTNLLYQRTKEHDGAVEFRHIKPAGTSEVKYGDENILKSEQLGSVSEVVDNIHGVGDVEVDFHDTFSKTDTHDETDSEGGSLKISLETTQSVEGIAEFKESVEAEAHREFSETDSSSSTKEEGGEEGTTVPGPKFDAEGNLLTPGERVRIIETRARADGEIDAKANGRFTYSAAVGLHSGGKFVGGHNAYFDSEQQFHDVVLGNAPDNWNLAQSFKKRPAYKQDLWALDIVEAPVKFRVKFVGRIVRSYKVEAF